MLEACEVLDDIKTCFFELDELTLGFTPTWKDKYQKDDGTNSKNCSKRYPDRVTGWGFSIHKRSCRWSASLDWGGLLELSEQWTIRGYEGYFHRLLKVTKSAGLIPY